MTKKARRNKTLNGCKDAKGDGEKIWKVIREATDTKPKANITPNFIKVQTAGGNHKKIQNKTEIANEMNRQFCQMGANLADKLNPTTAKFTDYLPSPNPNYEIHFASYQ